MDIKLLEPKMRVLIDLECKITKNNYGFADGMEKMVGTAQIIQRINSSTHSVEINNFLWSAEDLTILETFIKTKKQPTVRFDVKELVV